MSRKKSARKSTEPREGEIILYTTPEGAAGVEVFFQDESFWLTINRMADLFGTTKQVVNYHLQQIYESEELRQEATVKEILPVQQEGNRDVSRKLDFYNLDAIIAVGYRVNSRQATQFRIWATQVLREFIIKGFVLDDERLKQGKRFGKDYFDELLERIREIRASERRFYLNEKEIKALERVVTLFLDYAENQAARQIPMKMKDWVSKLDAFLKFNEYDILQNAGRVSHEVAKALAEEEYSKFRVVQDRAYESDFEQAAKRLKRPE